MNRFVLTCIGVLSLPLSALAAEWVAFEGCVLSNESSMLDGYEATGVSNLYPRFMIRINMVMALGELPQNRDDHDGQIECTFLYLTNGQKMLVVGSEQEIINRVFRGMINDYRK